MAVVYAVKNPISFDVPLKPNLHQAKSYALLRSRLPRYIRLPQRSSDVIIYAYMRKLAGKFAIAIQGTIAYAMSPHAVLTDSTARAASYGCIAVFDCKCNAQASDTLSSIEAHIGPGRH